MSSIKRSNNLTRGILIGEDNGRSKLTDEQVREIKILIAKSKLTLKYIAKQYNVSITIINFIKSGKTWKHITF